MTGPRGIALTSPCPGCGADAWWFGRRVGGDDGGDGTEYEVLCDRCDQAWTVGAQARRKTERKVS